MMTEAIRRTGADGKENFPPTAFFLKTRPERRHPGRAPAKKS
jgi:hypothetical protein